MVKSTVIYNIFMSSYVVNAYEVPICHEHMFLFLVDIDPSFHVFIVATGAGRLIQA